MPSIPLMDQYSSIKKQYPSEILFFRLGDFYEMFYEDARTASKVLSLTLTSRYKGDKTVPMAGIPYHAATNYINRLLKNGYKIAICEQLEDPAQAGKNDLIKRGVIRVLTPGTLVEEGLVDSKHNNFLASFNMTGQTAGFSWVDVSTGSFYVMEGTKEETLSEFIRVNPSECLVPESLSPNLTQELKMGFKGTLTVFPDWAFDRTNGYKILTRHFGVANLSGFGVEEYRSGLGAAGAVLEYLNKTQSHPAIESPLALSGLKHITRITPFIKTDYLMLDPAVVTALELIQNRSGQPAGLLSILDRTVTGMGARLLKEWLLRPLRESEPIRKRQSAIGWLSQNIRTRLALQREMKRTSDLERIIARLGVGRSFPRDLVALKDTLSLVPVIKPLLSGQGTVLLLKEISDNLNPLPDLVDYIHKSITDDPPMNLMEGNIIRAGFDAELDKTRSISREGKQWIARFEADEIKRTGIPSLKVGFNNVFGYYIEVTNTHKEKIPADYLRKQTLKAAERYITPQLKDYETQVLHATERANRLEYELFKQVRIKVAQEIPQLKDIASALATLDVLLSLAQVASENNYSQPIINDGFTIKIIDGRHPVLEKTGPEKFIPNDVLVDNEDNRVLLITGPNMAGKSTYIRQAALLVLMAQMGSFIPAREAEIGLVDRIFTRVGASDELTRGASTFMVEMNEVAHILNNATERSLIILDEVGRGTSTFDGVSIAWAVTEYIHDHKASRTLFATHYHELTELALILPGVKNYHIQVKEWTTPHGDEVIFLHKIAPGGTDKSYGIQVARLAGLPKQILQRAKLILANLEAISVDAKGQPKFAPPNTSNIPPVDPYQLALFQPVPAPLLKMLEDIDPNTLTPIEALAKLQQLKDIVRIRWETRK